MLAQTTAHGDGRPPAAENGDDEERREALRAVLGRAEHARHSLTAANGAAGAADRLWRVAEDLAIIVASTEARIAASGRQLARAQAASQANPRSPGVQIHEARGALTVIKGRATWLRRRALTASPPDLRLIDGLAEIDLAADRLLAALEALAAAGTAEAPTRVLVKPVP